MSYITVGDWPWPTILSEMNSVVRTTEDLILEKVGVSVNIDEIAVITRSLDQERSLVHDFVESGCGIYFNAAWDDPHTSPIRSQYRVHYSFLQPQHFPWRVEVMRIGSGVSPLHSVLMEQSREIGRPLLVHASFKAPTMNAYRARCEQLSESFNLAQECASEYGRFSYYTLGGDEDWPVYIKPRVNLRDGAPDFYRSED